LAIYGVRGGREGKRGGKRLVPWAQVGHTGARAGENIRSGGPGPCNPGRGRQSGGPWAGGGGPPTSIKPAQPQHGSGCGAAAPDKNNRGPGTKVGPTIKGGPMFVRMGWVNEKKGEKEVHRLAHRGGGQPPAVVAKKGKGLAVKKPPAVSLRTNKGG